MFGITRAALAAPLWVVQVFWGAVAAAGVACAALPAPAGDARAGSVCATVVGDTGACPLQ